MPPIVPTSQLHVDVHLHPEDLRAAMEVDVRRGLTTSPKSLPPVYFYDDRGSELFDQITRLPEYYPTRAERSILRERADELVHRSGADTLVELGSGTSEKTRILLDAFDSAGRLARYVPFDVCEGVLRDASVAIGNEHRGCEVHGVVGDFNRHLGVIPKLGDRLVAFLGGTIGNFEPGVRADFLDRLRSTMSLRDRLLLGTDLVKDERRLVAAYDDATGVTAEFNRNVLRVLNRELHADFDVDAFQHKALWNATDRWIEMRLVAHAAQDVTITDLGLAVHFDDGEELLTEISAKFTKDQVADELAAAGFEVDTGWTDMAGDFLLTLATPI